MAKYRDHLPQCDGDFTRTSRAAVLSNDADVRFRDVATLVMSRSAATSPESPSVAEDDDWPRKRGLPARPGRTPGITVAVPADCTRLGSKGGP